MAATAMMSSTSALSTKARSAKATYGARLASSTLSAALHASLPALGCEVLGARRLSPGDAGLALGQAWVALHQLAAKET